LSKYFKIAAAILCCLILLIIVVGIFWYNSQFSAPQGSTLNERFVVSISDTQTQIVSNLKTQGFIKSEWGFSEVLKIKGWENKIQPGAYQVSKNMDAWQLAVILTKQPYQKWVVIPEGLRKEQVADILQQQLNLSDSEKQNFLNDAKEGYLFPDTYLLDSDYTGQQIAERMMSQFNTKAADVFNSATKANIRNDTLVILASLIQREAANDQEMPTIAGVMWNRLTQNMPLQIDASVQYVLGKEGDWWPKITPADYQIDSPYNTYTNKGKPVAPICSPGLAAMNAVVNYQDSNYLYYLHDSQGQIHLAKTYQEQLDNINKYLK
jgi:UPF0755 protein